MEKKLCNSDKMLLTLIPKKEPGIRIKELVKKLNVTKQDINVIIRRLEQQEMIIKSKSLDDKKAVYYRRAF